MDAERAAVRRELGTAARVLGSFRKNECATPRAIQPRELGDRQQQRIYETNPSARTRPPGRRPIAIFSVKALKILLLRPAEGQNYVILDNLNTHKKN
jgi:hypothetical protein